MWWASSDQLNTLQEKLRFPKEEGILHQDYTLEILTDC